jgi:hypothetical protein
MDLRLNPLKRLYSYAVPNQTVLGQIVAACSAHSHIIEFAAGTGYWASLLRTEIAKRGSDLKVVALDISPPTLSIKNDSEETLNTNEYHGVNMTIPFENGTKRVLRHAGTFGSVLRGSVDKYRALAQLMPLHALLVIWPPPGDTTAAEVLKAYKGDTLIFVGERPGYQAAAYQADASKESLPPHGLQTAESSFFTILEGNFALATTMALSNYPYNVDDLTVWKRKTNTPVPTDTCDEMLLKCDKPIFDSETNLVNSNPAQCVKEVLASFINTWDGVLAAYIM